jgi:serine protease Do
MLQNRSGRALKLLLTLLVFVAGGLFGAELSAWKTHSAFEAGEAAPVISSGQGVPITGDVSFANGFMPIVKRVVPAVVNIASSKIVRSPDQGPSSPFFSDPFFKYFFGDEFSRQFQVPREQREHSLGSGVIVGPSGYVLTNDHVVDGATEIKVSLADKREFKASIVGTDPKTDIAVLKIEAKDTPVLQLGDSSKVQVGEFVLAVGDPFGVGQTVTMGIISATGRGGLGIEDYEDFIQTDAAVNPGNSGGALVNVRGELVGINTAILSGSGGNQGVGFAIPVNMARQVMDQLVKHGKVVRGWLGVVVQPMTPTMMKVFGLSGDPRGALVSDVTPDSPAARSGLSKGDVILELNGESLTDSRTLSLKISMMSPGTLIQLKIFREGRERTFSATLGELPAKREAAKGATTEKGAIHLGLSVEPLTPEVLRELGLPRNTAGIIVADVEPGSNAEEAGLRRGDIIQEVNRRPVTNVDQFRNAVESAGNQPTLLLINRAGGHVYVVIESK